MLKLAVCLFFTVFQVCKFGKSERKPIFKLFLNSIVPLSFRGAMNISILCSGTIKISSAGFINFPLERKINNE